MGDRTNQSRDRVLAVLLTTGFMSMLCATIINVALPSIQRGLGASGEDPQWILAGHSLTFGVLLIPAGRAGDLFGHGRVFVLGVTLFEVVLALLYTGTINVYIIQTMFIQQGLGGGPCRKE